MRIRTLLATALVAAGLATSAQASLIAGSSASGGTVIDTVNGAEWLRLDITRGQTVAAALASYGSDGFTWATQTQLNLLLNEFFAINGGDPGTRAGGFVFGAATTAGAESAWNSLFGLTYPSGGGFRESLGFYNDGVTAGGTAWYGFNSNPATFNSRLTQPVGDIGVFLIRTNAVPEPGSLALVAVAGLALTAAGRRARRQG